MKYIFVTIYLLIIIIYSIAFMVMNWNDLRLLASNELGDFLAGVFAPLAFFYLFLGFKQQGKAIKKSNEDILAQLQIQKDMISLQAGEAREREHAAKPNLNFHAEIISGNKIEYNTQQFIEIPNTKSYRLKLTFKNSGEKITHVSVQCIKPFKRMVKFNAIINKNDKLLVEFFIDPNLFPQQSSALSDIDVELTYTTSIGATYRSIFEINLPLGLDGNNISYTTCVNDVKIN